LPNSLGSGDDSANEAENSASLTLVDHIKSASESSRSDAHSVAAVQLGACRTHLSFRRTPRPFSSRNRHFLLETVIFFSKPSFSSKVTVIFFQRNRHFLPKKPSFSSKKTVIFFHFSSKETFSCAHPGLTRHRDTLD